MSVERVSGSVERPYEIGFDGDVTAVVLLATPSAQVSVLPMSTILWQRLRWADELDVLLDSLLDMGITPAEVYEAAGGIAGAAAEVDGQVDQQRVRARSPYCEVRIRGRLGDAVLQYLGWSHRVVETTVVRLHASDEDLRNFLGQLAPVTRLDYLLAL
jgi:hypothetical protein